MYILRSKRHAPILLISLLLWTLGGCSLSESSGGGGGESARVIDFSGYNWEVKSSGAVAKAPGPNYFSDSHKNVYLDEDGYLNLEINYRNGTWYTAEVVGDMRLGYGKYIFQTIGRIDELDPQAVLGLFTWDTEDPDNAYREVDIEFSRWGDQSNQTNGQYVVQPFSEDPANRRHRYSFSLTGTYSTHVIDWSPSKLSFASYYGHVTGGGIEIASWVYAGTPPSPGNAGPRINLWLFEGGAPQETSPAERIRVVIRDFIFKPY